MKHRRHIFLGKKKIPRKSRGKKSEQAFSSSDFSNAAQNVRDPPNLTIRNFHNPVPWFLLL